MAYVPPPMMELLPILAQAVTNALWRYAPQLVAGGVAILSLVMVEVSLRRLTRKHQRLLRDLKSEFAERLKAEEARLATEGFYHSLVESLPASILRKDAEGRFTFGNRLFHEALGVTESEQFVGKTDLDFFPRDLAEK